jgi:hypothetical protein
MNHGHRNQTLLRPLSIDFSSTPQFDTRSAPLSGDSGSAISQVGRPSGTSVRMRDSAGTSMALNIDIHPVYRTPLISGQAITAQGDVLEVHPCGCNNPIASRHNLPMTGSPEPSRGKSLFPDPHDSYPTPNSRIYQMPGSAGIRTPLVLVRTHLPTPPHATELLQELEIPAATPGTNANLGSPLTPTPESVRRTTQSSSTGVTYHTTPEEPSVPPIAPNSCPPPHADPSSSQAPKLGRMPTQSTFDPHLEMPAVLSPSSMSLFSGISEPSAIGPPLSLPSPSSDVALEYCPCAVLPFSRPVTNVQQNRTPTESNINRPSSRSAGSQAGGGPSVAEVTLPGQPEDIVHPANDDTVGTHEAPVTTGITTDQPLDRDPINPPEIKTGSTSDLYNDHVSVRLQIPTAMIGLDGEELRYDLTAQSGPGPSSMRGRFRVRFLVTSLSSTFTDVHDSI